jgi:hypothetical protein
LAIVSICAAQAQEQGRLLGVRAGGDAGFATVELLGDRPLSFTTLKLSAPPRIVVDLAETALSGTHPDLTVEDGTIRRVAAAPAGARTARVVIELAADAEFDVRAHGSRVEVRVPRVAPLLAKADQTRAAAPQAVAQSKPAPVAPSAAAKPDQVTPPGVALVGRRPRPAAAAPSSRRIALADPARRAITGIGFRPNGGGEVIVRSDQPLEYGISGEGNAVLLHLPSAKIPIANNRRALDTRFFGGPVERVVPLPVPGGTDVRIELRRHVEYQLAQSGSVLTVSFSSPGP